MNNKLKIVLNPIERRADLTLKDETKTIFFTQLDEWAEVHFHNQGFFVQFCYERQIGFLDQTEWLQNILVAYPMKDNEPDYTTGIVNNITLEL